MQRLLQNVSVLEKVSVFGFTFYSKFMKRTKKLELNLNIVLLYLEDSRRDTGLILERPSLSKFSDKFLKIKDLGVSRKRINLNIFHQILHVLFKQMFEYQLE